MELLVRCGYLTYHSTGAKVLLSGARPRCHLPKPPLNGCISCLGFSQLLISVGFHLLTNLGSFQPLFLSYFFSATIFILSFLDSDLVIVSQVPKALLFSFFLFFLFFLKFISSLLFRLGNFYYPSFCFTDSLHHLLHSAVHHNS